MHDLQRLSLFRFGHLRDNRVYRLPVNAVESVTRPLVFAMTKFNHRLSPTGFVYFGLEIGGDPNATKTKHTFRSCVWWLHDTIVRCRAPLENRCGCLSCEFITCYVYIDACLFKFSLL